MVNTHVTDILFMLSFIENLKNRILILDTCQYSLSENMKYNTQG